MLSPRVTFPLPNISHPGLSLSNLIMSKRIKLVAWINKYFIGKQWPLVPFQPILYLFIFSAAVRLWIDPDTPPAFGGIVVDEANADHFYDMWLLIGIMGPILSLVSWFMIAKGSGKTRFVGLWARFASDIMVATTITAYHITAAIVDNDSESRVYARYVQGGVLFFVLCLIVRDVWTLILTERIAGRIHRNE